MALARGARVVVARRPKALRDEARVLAQDLRTLTRRRWRTSLRRCRACAAATWCSSSLADAGLGAEGYRLRIGRTC